MNYHFSTDGATAVPPSFQNEFNTAAGKWNAKFTANGRTARTFNQGAGYEISVDPSLSGTGEGAVWSSTGIRFEPSLVNSPDASIRMHAIMHELGHEAGWGDKQNCPSEATLMGPINPDAPNSTDLTINDDCAFQRDFPPIGGGGGGTCDPNFDPTCGCDPRIDECDSPIIVMLGAGDVTTAISPPDVQFDLGSGAALHSWPDASQGAGFLVLDRDGDGAISSARELFGSMTPLSWGWIGPRAANGFEALRAFDAPDLGGNGDGQITDADLVYSYLMVWFDRNHDGICDPSELVSLRSLNIVSIGTTYAVMGKRDQFGNLYRFKGQLSIDTKNGIRSRSLFDIILIAR